MAGFPKMPYLRVLMLAVIINTGFGLIFPFLPTLYQASGLAWAMMSLPFAALIAGRLLARQILSLLLRRFTQGALLVGCFAGYALVFNLYMTAEHIAVFTIIRLLEGGIEGVAAILLTQVVSERTRNDPMRGKVMGWFTGAFSLGMIIGPALGSALYAWQGKQAVFGAGVGLSLLGIWAAMPFARLRMAPGPSSVLARSGSWSASIRLFGLYIPSMIRRVMLFGFMLALPAYLTSRVGLGVSTAGLYFSAAGLICTLAMTASGRLADRWPAAKVAIYGLIAMGLAVVTLGCMRDLVAFTLVFVLETLAFALMLPAGLKLFAQATDTHPDRVRLLANCFVITEGITLVLAFLLPALMAQNIDYAFYVLGTLALLSATFLI